MFHVPERARRPHPYDPEMAAAGTNSGYFEIDSVEPGWLLCFICSDGEGWEHVSVRAERRNRRQQRTPTWREMTQVKNLCWNGDDVVMQLHPRQADYVNRHEHVLHLWRPIGVDVPTPPVELV